MNPIIVDYLLKLEFGEMKVFDHMAIFPRFICIDDPFPYLTLQEALEKRLLTITEVTQDGSVPEPFFSEKNPRPLSLSVAPSRGDGPMPQEDLKPLAT